MAGVITAQIALRHDAADSILVNLGSNNFAGALGTEADFKTNFRTILTACHSAYPAAPIYLARPVRLNGGPPSTPRADNVTVRGWIDDLIAEQTYCMPGQMRRIWKTGMGMQPTWRTQHTRTMRGTRMWAERYGWRRSPKKQLVQDPACQAHRPTPKENDD